jgi:hypothetical protein
MLDILYITRHSSLAAVVWDGLPGLQESVDEKISQVTTLAAQRMRGL